MDKTLAPLGVDVAKRTLDMRLLLGEAEPFGTVDNTPTGWQQLQQWLVAHGHPRVHACLEATGTYSDGIATFLQAQGHQVSVVDPLRVGAFRHSEGIRTKTDRQDALVLARLCQQKRPPLWQPPTAELANLRAVLMRIEDVQTDRQRESNRLENSRWDAASRQQILAHLQQLDGWLTDLRKRAEAVVKQSPALQAEREVLRSVPGIGLLTATRLLSVQVSRFAGADQLVAYTGIATSETRSGTSVHGKPKMSRKGDPRLRKWLYLCALTAMTRDPDFKQWAAELKARGKCHRVIRIAVCRKLLHVIFGVVHSGQPYDPRNGRGVVGKNFCLQVMSGVQIFVEDEINPFIGTGVNPAAIDDFQGDNFDHAGLGFFGGGYLYPSISGGRPIQVRAVPPGTPR